MIFCTTAVRILLLLLYGKVLAFGFDSALLEDRKCKTDRFRRMHRISCTNMDLREVPKNLRSFVEMLNLQFNRIRWLDSSSFDNYRDVKFLLLSENMIQTVEPGTFKHLKKLEEVDLAYNSLTTLPMELLHMPSLRNIYIEGNFQLGKDLFTDIKSLDLPITAPLEYINMADCRLKDIPNLGVLPHLWQINISINPLTELSLSNFANMCNIKIIDMTRTKMNTCTCQQANSLFLRTGVDLKYIPVCPKLLNQNQCPLPYYNETDTELYRSCQQTFEQVKLKSTLTFSLTVVGCILTAVLLIFCCIHSRRRKRQRKKKAELSRKPFVISPKNAINPNGKKQEPELLDKFYETA